MSPEEKPFKPLWYGVWVSAWPASLTALLRELLEEVWPDVRDRAIKCAEDVWKAFPHPFKMLDLVVAFVTGIPGILIAFHFLRAKRNIIEILQLRKLDNKLIRVDDAVDGFINSQIMTLKQVTFTSENGLFEYLLQRFGTWLWRLKKKIWLFSKLIKAKSEAELIAVLINSYKGKFKFFKLFYACMGVAAFVIGLSITICLMSFSLNFGEFYAYILAQDSKRVRGLRKNTQYRVNEKKGPDK